jgi:hypothetical protein
MAGDTGSHHQFVVSNDVGVVIRCCIHCGLSHQMERDRQTHKLLWTLILEKEGDRTFAEPCPGESGSDDLFPYHHFILSNHHRQTGAAVVIRFCVRCGLSHLLSWETPYALGMQVQFPPNISIQVPNWHLISEDERDMTISDLCPAEQGNDALKRRYTWVPPKN